MRQTFDGSLVVRALAGDGGAATRLFERHWLTAWRIAFAVTRDRSLADDAAQDALIRAFASLSSFDPTRPFEPWLGRIASRSAIDHLRRRPQWAADALELPQEIRAPDDGAGELGEQIARAVLALHDDRRIVVVLRYWADLGIEEIALLLGAPAGTVASRLSRGLNEIRRTIEEGTHARPGL